ncbi:MAG: cytochrome CBB3 [Isosphaeraceae bacterium]|jgi:putative heme-binding domain-containing protein|nr:MAG: cytochrome CBB3 [Isosphaeraceae bacterium]
MARGDGRAWLAGLVVWSVSTGVGAAEGLTERLLAEGASRLAEAARSEGNARRGAVLFHRPALGCASCHDLSGQGRGIGPDLAHLPAETTPEQLVASILEPSREIRPEYATVVVGLSDGRTITGTLAGETDEALELNDAANPGQRVTIARALIEERAESPRSLMPGGLVDTLADRREFLDLARYVIEIAAGGRARVDALQPTPAELAAAPLPFYEHDLDHAGLIREWDEASRQRGAALYQRVCANCHGTPTQAGTLPNSPRFWADPLKRGTDPLAMYQTLTRGYGQMAAQTWMVPRQKYDVIHFIREEYFRRRHDGTYTEVDESYLAGLPKGVQRGPEPNRVEPWVAMDYGDVFAGTIEVGDDGTNIAYKGLAVRLDPGPGGVSRGTAWALYELDTMRLAAFWTGTGFLDWAGIQLDGRHEVHPRVVGRVRVANPDGPGWANPETDDFADLRIVGRDGRRYGPLPRSWIRRLGRYDTPRGPVLAYEVGGVRVLEQPTVVGAEGFEPVVLVRRFDVAASDRVLRMRVGPDRLAVRVVPEGLARPEARGGVWYLRIPASNQPRRFTLLVTDGPVEILDQQAGTLGSAEVLAEAIESTAARELEAIRTRLVPRDDGSGPLTVEELALPVENPWQARIRPTGFDFVDETGDAAVVSTWDGDVWRVDGLTDPSGTLQWRRVATGLYQPLGLKRIGGAIYVTCRDQIAVLHDRNGDERIDFYETFNNDQQVTEHFHEFAMGLQTDAAGNLYYGKAARHARTAVVPQHGTLLRVSPDGLRTEIVATGFRAPNGVCVNDDGTFFVTDQEGHWTPKNRLNCVRAGGFYGNRWAYTEASDRSDEPVEPPVCFVTNAFDRSPAEPVQVPERLPGWERLGGVLLSLSYGYGKIFVVPYETVGGVRQGGMAELPMVPTATGLLRGRFHPRDGRLYVCGMFAWAGNQTEPGGFYRIRPTGRPLHVPTAIHAVRDGLVVRFSDPLDPEVAADAGRWGYRTWSLRRSADYGSPHLGEREHAIRSVAVEGDGRTVRIVIEGFGPTTCYELTYGLRGADGSRFRGAVDGTVHRVGP